MSDGSADKANPISSPGDAVRLSREESVAQFLAEIGIKDDGLLDGVRNSLRGSGLSQQSIDQAFEQWLRASDPTVPIENTTTSEANVDGETDEVGETVTIPQKEDAYQATFTHHAEFTIKDSATTGQFGDYEILDEIAKGGMGVVYKARQTKLNRIVALKMIRSAELADASQVKRFYTEAEAAAKLTHPGIVPVYDVGEANGQHYFSMAFVDGESLSDRVKRDGPLMPREAAQLMKEAAEAVDHAHQAEIVHRDIKPQNLLLDPNGKVQVADFGLAKLQQGGSELTADGQVLGTPAYMPPEQAAGKLDEVGAAADVYSLGATLYFLLTGRPPFQAATVHDTLRQVLDNEPVPPRKLDPSIPRDLETICLKALSKEPPRRYATAGDFAADLEHWLHEEPIVARRVGRIERTWKWCKRKPVIAGLSATVALILALGSIVLWERLNAAHARGLVDSLIASEPAQVPRLVGELENYSYWAHPLLRRTLDAAAGNTQTTRPVLHARMALASEDASLADKLIDDLLDAEIGEVGNIRDALGRSPAVDRNRLWQVFRGEATGDRVPKTTERLRAGLALVTLDAHRQQWKPEDNQFLVEQLVTTNAVYQPLVWDLLDNVKGELLEPLESVFVAPARSEGEQIAAANAIARFASQDGSRLGRLLCVATPKQYEILHEKYQRVANDETRNQLVSVVAQEPTEGMMPEDSIALGRKRAGAAITLLRQGERESIFEVFRNKDDPEALSQFVARCRERSVTIQELLECFEVVDAKRGPLDGDRQKVDDGVLYALLLALGEYTIDELPTPSEPRLERLAKIYALDPSSGVHSATGWLLRQWGQGEVVAAVDQTSLAYDETGHREWYVQEVEYSHEGPGLLRSGKRKLHFTFILFPAGSFTMGSPENEPNHESDERVHQVHLTRPLAVCDRELTWAQWDAFNGDRRRNDYAQQFSETLGPGDPAFGMNWFEAVGFCRWLGEQAGLSEDQQCYADPTSLPEDSEGNPTEWRLDLEGLGYRLMTEAEWEYACRGRTGTAHSFGQDRELLSRYAWYRDNSGEWTHPVAQLRPNPRGLFDNHGNLHEWCHDWDASEVAEATDPIGGDTGLYRVNRGGAWGDTAGSCRSSFRRGNDPTNRLNSLGFRLAVVPSSSRAGGQQPASEAGSGGPP